jgi:Effector-associated domain 11
MSKQRQQPTHSRLILELSPELASQLFAAFQKNQLSEEEARSQVRQFLQNSSAEESLNLPEEITIDLLTIKNEFKELIIEDIGQALKVGKEKLILHTSSYDTLVILYARYNRVNRSLQQNIIDFQTADLEMSKLENAFIYLVNNLLADDLK